MSDSDISEELIYKIENCNNIVASELHVKQGQLNIKYAVNGTGKSTMAKAIQRHSRNEDLSTLITFGSKVNPRITSNKTINSVMVFDENFISNTVFKEREVIDNGFEVFIKSSDYDRRIESLNTKLRKLKIGVEDNIEFTKLSNAIDLFTQKIKLNSNGETIKNDSILKSITNKENIYRIPSDLEVFRPFLQNKEQNIDWIDWKTKGEVFDALAGCPFCAKELDETYATQKESFKKSYQKSVTKNLKDILDIIESLKPYLSEIKYELIGKCIKDDTDVATITQEITKLRIETEGIIQKIGMILQLNRVEIKREQIGQIAEILQNSKIQIQSLDYFTSELTKALFKDINEKISELEITVNELKVEIGEFIGFVLGSIGSAKKDINLFLKTAGINYELDIESDKHNSVKTVLKYVGPNDENIEVDKIRDHLSWGEKNAFSLILFMHYALSKKPDLIILDDPISSFDDNKKFAIINRLFSKNNEEKSFYQKTVLMLSHEFEPIIDFIYNRKPTGGFVNAEQLWNKHGNIECSKIERDNIVSWISLLRQYSKDNTLCIINRLAFLRKYSELHGDEMDAQYAYNIISSLQHGEAAPGIKLSDDRTIEMTTEQRDLGYSFIRKYIPDFDYSSCFHIFTNEQTIKSEYNTQNKSYLKLQLFRTYLEMKDKRCQIKDQNLIKYIDETYHIENDYIYYFDLLKYEIIPEYIIDSCNSFINK